MKQLIKAPIVAILGFFLVAIACISPLAEWAEEMFEKMVDWYDE